MKKVLLSVALLLSLGITAWAQVPNQFNYQGIARSATGTPLASTPIALRLTILEGSATGSVDYQETQNTTTNTYGLFNVFIGGSTAIVVTAGGGAANIGAVNWGSGQKFLRVEIDPIGGTDYSTAGTAQLLSVPYALYAANSPATGVTNVATGAGLTGGPITSTGTISMPNTGTPGTYGSGTQVPVITTDAQGRVTGVTNTAITVGGGTVTSVTAGTGLAGGTISTSGSISLGTTGTAGTYGSATLVPVFTTDVYGRVTSVTNTPIVSSGTGTVTSVTAGAGLSGGTITSVGTVSMPTVGTAGTYGSATGIPEITTDAYGRVTAVTVNPVSASITSTGTANYITKFTSPTAISNSGMYQNGANVGLGTTTPIAAFDAESASDTMAGFYAVTGSPSTANGVLTSQYQGATDAGIALQGNANNNVLGNNTIGVEGIGTSLGAYGIAASEQVSGGASVRGVEGDGLGDDQYAMGVGAYATPDVGSPLTTYGIVGNGTGGAVNYSGYFVGDVYVGGTLAKAGGTFKIDHPLDPANKYLEHSFVESPDMMNVYNGNITTDATGTAVVTLPDYFEALNKDYRYQLTVIGSFAQAMVSKEVSGNKFELKTNVPNVKVSWQVTGIRNDVWANAHRVVAEVEKESFNKGKYLDAKDLGKPDSEQIGNDIAHPSKRTAQIAHSTTAKNTQK